MADRPDAPDTYGISNQDAIAVWARQAVCWMANSGITTSNPYEPSNVVNRAQMSAFLYRPLPGAVTATVRRWRPAVPLAAA